MQIAPIDAELQTTGILLGVIERLTQEMEAQRKDARRSLEAARRELARLLILIEGLTHQLDLLLKDKDEERRAALVQLREEAKKAADAAAAEVAAGLAQTAPAKGTPPEPTQTPARRRDNHGRAAPPENLTRDVVSLRPDSCSHCGGTRLSVKGTLESEEYDYVRAHTRIRKTIRTICICADCTTRNIPEAPPMPFDRAACTFAMMAWLLFAKCGLFLPLDRLQRDFSAQGAPIPSATLTRWWQQGADLLLPVAASVRLSLLTGTHLRTDGTGLLVVFPRVKGEPVKGEARAGAMDETGYLLPQSPEMGQILIFGDDEHAVYHFTATKEGHHALSFLKLGEDAEKQPIYWRGTITADAASVQDCLFEDGDRLESGCNAHGLRKFRDEQEKAPWLASTALGYIRRFYSIEAEARSKELKGEALLNWRVAEAGPVAAAFKAWLLAHLADLLPTNPVRKAMQYYVNHWEALTRFLTDPAVLLDNNWSERGLRVIALLRKNALYASGVDGAERLCTVLTLIHTCRLLGVDPYSYLEWALTRVVPHSTNAGFVAADLTPAAYKALQEQQAQ
jgi:transposase